MSMPEKPIDAEPAKKGCFSLGAVLIGCGVVGLVGILLCGGAGVFGFRYLMAHVNAISKEFEDQGYERQTGQQIDVGSSPEKKTVYVCQLLNVNKQVDVDIAIVAQMCEVRADIHGDVDFYGQLLKVNSGAVIHGDLRVKGGQAIQIDGEVKGKITGSYATLIYKGKTYSPDQSLEAGEPVAPPADLAPPLIEPTPPTPPVPPEPPVPANTTNTE